MDKSYRISNKEKVLYYDYLIKFEKELAGFEYNWDDESLKKFLNESGIKETEGSGDYWIDLIVGHKHKGKAYSILKRFRNSMAHGHINKGRKYYYIYDYTSNKKKTLDCKLPVKLFWKLVETICATRLK